MLTCTGCGQPGWHVLCHLPDASADWVGLPFVEESTTFPALNTDGSFLFASYKPFRSTGRCGLPPAATASVRHVRMAARHRKEPVSLPMRRL